MFLLNQNIIQMSRFEIKDFKEIANMQRGRFGHRPRNDPKYFNGNYPFIQTGNIVKVSDSNDIIEYTQTLNELGLSTSKLFDEKVLVITIAANIGFTAILNYSACFPDSLVAIKTDSSIISLKYLNVYVRLIRKYIENLAPQAAQRNINLKQLGKIPIVIPDIEIQKNIVDIMDKAYQIKAEKETESQKLLGSINDYLLNELDIILPLEEENTLEKRMNYVSSSNVIGGRFDPRRYAEKYRNIFASIEKSTINRCSLRSLIINSNSGNWGYDENEKNADFISCLTIRATEFDNRYNLKLDNSRAKYRKYTPEMLDKMSLTYNDILIEKSGGSEDQPVGRVAIIDKIVLENKPLAFSNFIHKITINECIALPEFVFEYLTLMHAIKVTEVMQTQTNGIRNLIMNEYLTQFILLPDLDIQKQIVAHIKLIRDNAKQLENEALQAVENAKKEVEQILLGGEKL